MSEWGRVAADGTVYVRDGDGERVVGSWQAGSPEQGLAHFGRRYEQLSTEVALLEQRLRTGVGDPTVVRTSATRLLAALPTAAAVGDLRSLQARVEGLHDRAEQALAQAREVKEHARAQAAQAKAALAAEAEQLAGSSDWKAGGERLRTIGTDWKRLPPLDRKAEDELWQRVAAARQRFAERRTAHFAALEQQREVSRERKEQLIASAQALVDSTDWKATAERFKQLMSDWKAAGRAPRAIEDELWHRFKTAQDAFFTARSAQFAEQDDELRANQQLKEQILVEAERLDPANGLEPAKRRLRELQERWAAVGKVPRNALRSQQDRLSAVEARIRAADGARFRNQESPFTSRLREKVAELEARLERARVAGRPIEQLQAALDTQREWLAQAGGPPAALVTVGQRAGQPTGQVAGPPAKKKPTTAWVRADD